MTNITCVNYTYIIIPINIKKKTIINPGCIFLFRSAGITLVFRIDYNNCIVPIPILNDTLVLGIVC